jgi:branched-chain amino acid transport system ATP-binding protein
MKDLLLEVDSLGVSYGEMRVVWDVSFHVQKGEIVTILGSNGAGKTTTLKAISGLLASSCGSVRFNGVDISGSPPHVIRRGGVVLVPEGRKLFGTMSVMENLEIGAFTRDARKVRNQSLEYVYGLFPVLKSRRSQMAETLSGGEQQMLAIARALMARPTQLMLDEPSLALAPIIAGKIFQVIAKIHSEGIAVLLVEQNARAALEIADRAYVMEQGRIAMTGLGKEFLQDDELRKVYIGI